ncbi:hypothetical protein FLL45_20370 [Aliikangiella marina]|uniref:Uncharacterized protein n=1 Tax=Aliikangiella marina TaxID=1712262 RepID=A0A545T2S7_9GAMM|nr:hypothetical protein [Aliikangiella marina]TQV71509.1 hypothetical protein FLL45_20370 [Aliikangiella marina]
MYRGDDIIIDQLFVRANKKQVAHCVNQLELSSWDFNTQGRWIFVKSVSVKSPEKQLRLAASEKLKQLIYGANSSSDDKSSREVVVFDDFSKLLAELIGDIYTGKFGYCWYWKKWHYLLRETKNAALTRALHENVGCLPEVFNRLIEKGKLLNIVDTLSEIECKQILNQLNKLFPLLRRNGASKNDIASKASDFLFAQEFLKLVERNRVMKTLVIEFVNKFDVHDVRLHFVLSVFLRSVNLNREPQSILSMTIGFKKLICEENTHNESECPNKEATAPNSASLTSEQKFASVDSEKQSGLQKQVIEDGTVLKTDGTSTFKEASKLPIEQPVKEYWLNSKEAEKEVVFRSASKEKEANNSQESISEAKNDEYSSFLINTEERPCLLFDHDFESQAVGIFYLLNLLRLPECLALIQAEENDLNPWFLVFDLGRVLEVEFDTAMTNYFEELIMLSKDESIDELPRKPLTMAVYQTLLKDKRLSSLMRRDFFQVSGRVKASAAHLDCYFSMDVINLDLRLVGADVNPGWLPWLGKLVSFHYQ